MYEAVSVSVIAPEKPKKCEKLCSKQDSGCD